MWNEGDGTPIQRSIEKHGTEQHVQHVQRSRVGNDADYRPLYVANSTGPSMMEFDTRSQPIYRMLHSNGVTSPIPLPHQQGSLSQSTHSTHQHSPQYIISPVRRAPQVQSPGIGSVVLVRSPLTRSPAH